MTRPLIILGAGGNAYDVFDIVDSINSTATLWKIAGFLDDGRPPLSEYLGHTVLGPLADSNKFINHYFINTIRNDTYYHHTPEILASTGLETGRFATLVHPGASVSSRARLGRGVYVNHGVTIGGGVVVGDHVSLGPGCIVGHYAMIDDYTIVAPGAVISGSVHIGRACYIGAGACIRQRLSVGERSLVGLGAVVIADVAAEAVVVGNPARPLVRSKPQAGVGPDR